MYEKILKIAEKIAREIRYEPIYGTSAGGTGTSGIIDWILRTGFWRDIGVWVDTENWID